MTRTRLQRRPSDDRAPRDEAGDLRSELARLAAELEAARAHAARLEALAYEDPLTGVCNRRGFGRDLARALAYRARYGTPVAVILIDLDGFKRVNDTYGHGTGDRALAHVASLLRAHVRASDTIGRLGGDEFGLVVWQIEPAAAAAKAASLEAIVAATPLPHGDGVLPLAISAGVSQIEPDDTPESILARADAAMYARKHGRLLPSPGWERDA
ncbi:GGDEF domain-containing protein [Salinarimonas soli]|uniref:diguanylate cyclase n=1 Tax=Salinarimonas soli TaxID=1638099 RepID=A0A5B2VCV5_9HYPH|nr:GGDEF domain-containing protein [Salinarimonas soli]KAA2236891.1 GGDEF domain-containing protein [Salinarimonas soli]